MLGGRDGGTEGGREGGGRREGGKREKILLSHVVFKDPLLKMCVWQQHTSGKHSLFTQYFNH